MESGASPCNRRKLIGQNLYRDFALQLQVPCPVTPQAALARKSRNFQGAASRRLFGCDDWVYGAGLFCTPDKHPPAISI